MNPGTELRKEFVKVHASNGVVAKEIRAAQGVVIANVVIHFSQSVLRAIYVAGSPDCSDGIWDADRRVTNRSRCRNARPESIADGVHLTLKSTEIEELVWDHAATRTASVLFQFQRLLGSSHGIEEVASVEGILASETIRSPVNVIRSGFKSDAGDGARLPSKFCLRIDLSIELLNRIDGYERGRIAEDRRGVGHAKAHERFVIGDPVDDVTGVLGANAVGGLRPWSTTRVNRSAGSQGDEILVVAAIQGEVVDDLVADRAAKGGGGRVHHGDFLGYGDRFRC